MTDGVDLETPGLLDGLTGEVRAERAELIPWLLEQGITADEIRAGDWFGSPVNLASRVTSAARPGSVLVAQAAYDQVEDDDHFTWSFARARRLRGIKDDIKLYRARRAETV